MEDTSVKADPAVAVASEKQDGTSTTDPSPSESEISDSLVDEPSETKQETKDDEFELVDADESKAPAPKKVEKTVPYDRFAQVNRKNKELEESIEQLRSSSRKPVAPQDATAPEYAPDQLKQAEPLVRGVLREELADVRSLREEMQAMKAERLAQEKELLMQEDVRSLESALKKANDPTITRSLIEAQVVKWDSSSRADLRYLARAPYETIVNELKRMRAERSAKKPVSAPKVEAPGGGELPNPGRKISVNNSDPLSFRKSLLRGAMEHMSSQVVE